MMHVAMLGVEGAHHEVGFLLTILLLTSGGFIQGGVVVGVAGVSVVVIGVENCKLENFILKISFIIKIIQENIFMRM